MDKWLYGRLYRDAKTLCKEWNEAYKDIFHGEITPDLVQRTCFHFKVRTIKWFLGKQLSNFFDVNDIWNRRTIGETSDAFLEYIGTRLYGDRDEIINSLNQKDEPISYASDEEDMDKYSDYLINNVYQENKTPKKVYIEESQVSALKENMDNEGFAFRQGVVKFLPNDKTHRNADTSIFNNDKQLNVKKIVLPKSQVVSYNLYDITTMKPNKALKHKKDIYGNKMDWYSGENYTSTIDYFIKRSAFYIKHLIGSSSVDYLTCPQSSSQFNKIMLSTLKSYFPESHGIILKPDMLVKNIKGLYVNVQVAKSLGMTDEEIHILQRRVQKWYEDEDIREVRRKIESLKDEIAQTIATRHRGRPSKEFMSKYDMINNYEQQIAFMRQGKRGRDSTKNDDGSVKDWQIKSLDDKNRRALEGLFTLNPEYNGIQQYLVGKSVIVFDDNISSGATLDDFCLKLKELGVANIMAFTLGVIEPTMYKASEHMGS